MTYNVNSLGDCCKCRQIFRQLHKNKIDVACLQETHSTKNSHKIWKSEWGGEILYSDGKPNAQGVAILFSKQME